MQDNTIPGGIALRELIQNAQDAVLAREMLTPTFRGGEVAVSLDHVDESWLLEVSDNGVGMDERVLREGLLKSARAGGGISAVLALGDVTVNTRRYDRHASNACEITLPTGLDDEPPVDGPPPDEPHPVGTTIQIRLRDAPIAGLFARTPTDEIGLGNLVQRLAPASRVPITVTETGADPQRFAPFDLATASPSDVFTQIYPPPPPEAANSRRHWDMLRESFCAQATPLVDNDGRRLGLAVLGRNVALQAGLKGVVVVDGFRVGEHDDFIGYMDGKPGSSRNGDVKPNGSQDDDVALGCTPDRLRNWIADQAHHLQEQNRFGPSEQLELSDIVYRATGRLPDDHVIAMTSKGLTTVAGIRAWAAGRDEITYSYGWPCEWQTRPPALTHRATNTTTVTPPDGWLIPYLQTVFPYLDKHLPRKRDRNYEQHHNDRDTWQLRYWLASDLPEGLTFQLICDAWSCTLEDLLGPVAKRGWDDEADLGIASTEPAPVYHLRRP